MKIARFIYSLALVAALIAPVEKARAYTNEEVAAESAKANALFEKSWQGSVDRSPLKQGYLGIKKDEDKWDDFSDAHATAELAISLADLAEVKRTVNFEALDPETKLSYRLFERQVNEAATAFKWRFHDYPVNQMFGWQSEIPSFLITVHQIDDVKDAQAYIARLREMPRLFAQIVEGLEIRRKLGVVPPRFVFPIVIETSQQIIVGAPFDSSKKNSSLWEDFSKKIIQLKETDGATKDRLLAEAKDALLTGTKPAYENLIRELADLEKSASDDDGVWKLPNGRSYYDFRLRQETTTDLTAEQIHELGLREVERIHSEMRAIMKKVGFEGDLLAFFKFMREDPQFYYPNTSEGKEAYRLRAVEIIDTMRKRLNELFITKPKSQIVVKPVESFREKGAPAAFYQQGTPDGSRPGNYYINLYDMAGQPKFEMEALAYHEGIPGHHMQISIAQELTGIPSFRKYNTDFTAYVEGWALYCERIPKEMGFYSDPYADFGRLSMELLRASRLVVDTGLHSKKWTRQQTNDWLKANTPESEREIIIETNRYIVDPGQATAYKIGMIKLFELREIAKKELGDKFDLREYHDIVLREGALPLDFLEESVRGWIAKKKG